MNLTAKTPGAIKKDLIKRVTQRGYIWANDLTDTEAAQAQKLEKASQLMIKRLHKTPTERALAYVPYEKYKAVIEGDLTEQKKLTDSEMQLLLYAEEVIDGAAPQIDVRNLAGVLTSTLGPRFIVGSGGSHVWVKCKRTGGRVFIVTGTPHTPAVWPGFSYN